MTTPYTNNTFYGSSIAINLKNIDASCSESFGTSSQHFLTTGSYNTAMGAGCMNNNTTGELNVAVGSSALQGALVESVDASGVTQYAPGSAGDNNTAIGTTSLFNNYGNGNSALGSSALRSNLNGSNNTACGYAAGYYNTGENNTFLGAHVDGVVDGSGNSDFSNSTAVGYGATISASNQMVLGVSSTSISAPGSISCGPVTATSVATTGAITAASVAATGSITAPSIGVTGAITATSAVVTGPVTATSFSATSDYRIKQNVHNLESQTIDNLRPVSYYNTVLESDSIGLIAHEVQAEFPQLVTGDKDGEEHQRVDYIGLIAVLIHEIKALKTQVAALSEK